MAALRFTTEVPVLEQLLSSTGSINFDEAETKLCQLLDVALGAGQQERVVVLMDLQQRFEALRVAISQDTDCDAADIQLISNPLRSSTLSPTVVYDSRDPNSPVPHCDDDAVVLLDPYNPDDDDDDDDDDDAAEPGFNDPPLIRHSFGNPLHVPVQRFVQVESCSAQHAFCRSCVAHYWQSEIDNAELEQVRCPGAGCQSKPTEAEVSRLVSPDSFEKYMRFLVLAIVRQRPDVRWCPISSCSAAVSFDLSQSEAQCSQCNFRFCVKCSMAPHPDQPCSTILTEAEKEIAKWARELGRNHVKACPRCHLLTEKTSGCNHMTCGSCSYEWCWLCRGTYSWTHYSEGRCQGLQFAPFDTVREARWDEFGGREGWRRERIRRGELVGQRQYKQQEAYDPLVKIFEAATSSEQARRAERRADRGRERRRQELAMIQAQIERQREEERRLLLEEQQRDPQRGLITATPEVRRARPRARRRYAFRHRL